MKYKPNKVDELIRVVVEVLSHLGELVDEGEEIESNGVVNSVSFSQYYRCQLI